MPEYEPTCPSCGARVTQRLGEGLCAACLLALALEGPDEQPGDTQSALYARPEYRILAVLRGDEARTTYLGEEERSRALVAIEVVRAAAVAGMTPGLFDARIAELKRLRHPVIVPVLAGHITSSGDYCVVSQHVPGRTAGAWAAAALPSAGDVLHFFDRLCDAVGHAHAQHVVHGHLEPSCVLVTQAEAGLEPRLTGYSVCATGAREANDVAGLGHVLDSLARHSPETAREFARFVARAITSEAGRYDSVAELRGALERSYRANLQVRR